MKKKIFVTAIVLSVLISACSSSTTPQTNTATEKTSEEQAEESQENTDTEKTLGKQTEESQDNTDTQSITYHTIAMQIPADWKYVEDNDSIMIYNPADEDFFCLVDGYNISENIDESASEEDIYPLCDQLIQNLGGNDEFSYENGYFLGCPSVRFSGSVLGDDGSECSVNGLVFVADINMYLFYSMYGASSDHSAQIEVADQIVNSIEINTGAYGSSSQEETTETPDASSDTAIEEKEKTQAIQTAESYKNMKLGEIGKKDDIYVGLSYVKKTNYVPTALYDFDEIGDGNEVILAFFDFYNASANGVTVHPEDITCYADGSQVLDAQENYMSVYCDGIRQLYSVDMDGNTQMISVHDFVVPSGWSELKFFYESECVWTVTADDVSEEDFEFESMYDLDIERESTEEDSVIYKGDYEIIFKGATDYTYSNSLGETPYVIFKFTVNNTSSAPLDYSLAGYEMRGYQANYSLGDSSFALDEQIDGYSNIYSIDKIEAGMSADIYIAFDAFVEDGDLYMVYDDGYIQNAVRGTVFVDR